MSENEYNPEEALGLLMRKVWARDEVLAEQIQEAIDAGKDIAETEPSTGRKKARVYRKTVSFTHEEALLVAIDALQAHFVEQPLFVESASKNFTKTAVGQPSRRLYSMGFEALRLNSSKEREEVSMEQENEEKVVEIELQTETQIEKSGPETQILKKLDQAQIEKRQHQLNTLRRLLHFQLK